MMLLCVCWCLSEVPLSYAMLVNVRHEWAQRLQLVQPPSWFSAMAERGSIYTGKLNPPAGMQSSDDPALKVQASEARYWIQARLAKTYPNQGAPDLQDEDVSLVTVDSRTKLARIFDVMPQTKRLVGIAQTAAGGAPVIMLHIPRSNQHGRVIFALHQV